LFMARATRHIASQSMSIVLLIIPVLRNDCTLPL
jgi:hypothetical protein